MPDLLKSVEDGVMKLTFNRPDAMNALSRDMMGASPSRWKRRQARGTSAAWWSGAPARRRSVPAAT